MTYILSIDQGTTSTRALLFDTEGHVINTAQKELPLHYPHKGWVEQDPEDIWNDTKWACRDVLKKSSIDAAQIASIGITNQRETTILWDRDTGKPVYNAIVWQDRRTADLCKDLKAAGHEDIIQNKTGLLIDPYFSGTKIKWILDNVQGARQKAESGKLAFGTVDSFLLWHLTGGKVHATDVTNAARTLAFNIQTRSWDQELLDILDIPLSILPDVQDNVAEFGQTTPDFIGKPVTIGGMAGDQHAAMIGQACFQDGMVKSTYGTGCFLLMNIGDTLKTSDHRLLTTPAYSIDGKITYAMEGAIFVAGAAIQWLRDGLGIIEEASQSETLAQSVTGNGGVYFVPAFTGLGAPWWDPEARAAIFGLTRENTKAHIVRAALEAQAYQTLDLMDAIARDTGKAPETIRVDGGLVENNFVCQFLADMLGVSVDRPTNTETTAQGAAYLAGLHAGIYSDLDMITEKWNREKTFTPDIEPAERDALYKGWQDSLKRIIST